MYAIFSAPGRQIKAAPGETLQVDYLEAHKEGDQVVFDKVLAYSNGDSIMFGTPFLAAKVRATVLSHFRDDKVIVYKKKRRVDYHKKQGHRQWYTTVRIDSIEA